MIQIFQKELNSFFDSLIAYLFMGVFLVSIGLFMWVLPGENVLDAGFADMETLFSNAPYILMFLIPAITMRSFADEKKAGTLELLFTKPLRDSEIIAGKFLASFAIALFTILPTLVYYFSISALGDPVGNLDTSGIIGSYLGLIMLAGVFVSVGILASSLSDNQIVAFITAIILCYLFYTGFSALAGLETLKPVAETVYQIGIAYHYSAVSKGLVDSRDLVYFLSVIACALAATRLVLASRKW
ncbi:MAG: gliding motility-associated ABC transporter permease subunit GldF [Cytophagales bacterium]